MTEIVDRAGASRRHLHANDDLTWMKIMGSLVKSMPVPKQDFVPFVVGVVFAGLLAERDQNLSLFVGSDNKAKLSQAIDALNKRIASSVVLANVHHLLQQAPNRIAFGTPDQPSEKQQSEPD